MDPRPLAITRAVPHTLPRAVRTDRSAVVDVDRARRQHEAYVEALSAGGFRIVEMGPDDRYPDSVFVEDTAVLLGGHAFLTRPALTSRRGEVEGVGRVLARLGFRVHGAHPPATIEGGDVLRIGSRLYVGRSARTNEAGIDQLAAVARPLGYEVVAVDVSAGLHLKSVVSAASARLLVALEGRVDAAVFSDLEVLSTPEPIGANVALLADGSVLVAHDAPGTAELLAGRGIEVRTVDVSVFALLDGGLTCLSLRSGVAAS